MPEEGFDRNVASKMPKTRSGRPKRPWHLPSPVIPDLEQETRTPLEDLSMDKLSIDKSSIEKKAIDNLSIEPPSIDKSSTPRTRYSEKFSYLFEHLLPGLDPTQQAVLLWLAWLSNEHGLTPPISYRDLSQRCGMSSKTAARTLKELIEKGRIQVEKTAYSREATVYVVRLPGSLRP